MKSSDKNLNKEQSQAVKHKNGPLLIIAGAGTGKTTVITERIKYLIAKGLAKPEEILALTFTEKGATEMEERIDAALPLSYGDLWVSTFHSFCDRVLRESAIEMGLSSNYKLMTGAQSISLMKRNLFDFNFDYFRPLGNPNKFIEGLLQHFSRLQDECVTPNDYISFVKNDYKPEGHLYDEKEGELEVKKYIELSNAYKYYSDLKLKNNVLDFGDLITYTTKLFKERPNILKRYHKKFKYILVDEFQDTNYAQNELLILLSGREQNITVVADDDQSIYRFRGAAVSNVIQFRNTFPKTKIIVLTKNYRSSQEILDSSYKLIQHNNPNRLEVVEKVNKKLNAVLKSKSYKVKHIQAERSQDEALEVAKEISSLVHNNGYNYSDVAVLVRANNHAESFIREFERNNIPHQFLGPSKLFNKEEVVDLISYLKVLYNPDDSVFFHRLLSTGALDIPKLEVIKISATAKLTSRSMFEVAAENRSEIVVKLLNIINKHLSQINTETAGYLLYDYINEIELYKKIIDNDDEVRAKNIAKFFDIIKNFENENSNTGVIQVVDYIDLLMEVGESPNITDGGWQENNAVNILTAHSSKGLEFPVVFLVNLVNERFPSRERHEQIPIPDELIKEVLPKGDYHIQEERRLFYVGMTRAKERLYLTSAKFYGDGIREKKVSQFVFEAVGDFKKRPGLKKIVNTKLIVPKKNKVQMQESLKNEKLKIDYLSVSQIETFKTCPLHYKLRYIYKLQTPPSASISFGVTIHNTLKKYYTDPTIDIIKAYKESFVEEGYLNKKHKQEFFKKGESYLLGFLNNGYNSKTKTILLEEKFNVKINSSLKIGGTIDRVDDLGNGRYEIIDYKTGANIPSQKDVDKDIQLSFYALALVRMYDAKMEDIKLSLYYLDTQEKITTRRTAEDLENLIQEILEIRDQIEKSEFKCNGNYFCQQGCEYSLFCNKD